MKQLRVAYIIKASPSTAFRDNRNMGYFSYPVPEFEWQHFYSDESAVNDFDLVIQEDGGPDQCTNVKKPFIFLSIDDTLSDAHLQTRLTRAKTADVILVDHSKLKLFEELGKPVYRFNYCVNDWIMKDYGLPKDVDVSFHCGRNEERIKLRQLLHEYCQANNRIYRSNTMGIEDYAQAMNRSKIVVNWPRTRINRPHRVFDSMACKACLVTGRLPDVSFDNRVSGYHYVECDSFEDIYNSIGELIQSGKWQQIAQNGYDLVHSEHRWSVRAKQLREIIYREFGI
jgi:hypothetical protein